MKATHSCTCAALLKKQKISWWVATKTSGSWGCAWRKMQSLHSWLHCLMPLEKGTHKGEKTSHLFKFQVQNYDNTAFPQHYLLWKYIFLSYPKGHLVPFHTKYLPSSSMLSTQKKKTLYLFLNLTFTLYCLTSSGHQRSLVCLKLHFRLAWKIWTLLQQCIQGPPSTQNCLKVSDFPFILLARNRLSEIFQGKQ